MDHQLTSSYLIQVICNWSWNMSLWLRAPLWPIQRPLKKQDALHPVGFSGTKSWGLSQERVLFTLCFLLMQAAELCWFYWVMQFPWEDKNDLTKLNNRSGRNVCPGVAAGGGWVVVLPWDVVSVSLELRDCLEPRWNSHLMAFNSLPFYKNVQLLFEPEWNFDVHVIL